MNINCLIMVFILSFARPLSTACFAQKTAPATVREAFSKKFPGVSDVDWTKENTREWEAEFEQNNTEMSANFLADGTWLSTETEIKVIELPAQVQAALKGKKIKEAARIELANGSTIFEAEVGRKDWLFDASGKRLNYP